MPQRTKSAPPMTQVMTRGCERMKNFGQRLRAFREQRKLSRRALAERISKTHNTLVNWERGSHSPTLGDLVELAEALGTDPLMLIGDSISDATNGRAMVEELKELLAEGQRAIETARQKLGSWGEVMPVVPGAGDAEG